MCRAYYLVDIQWHNVDYLCVHVSVRYRGYVFYWYLCAPNLNTLRWCYVALCMHVYKLNASLASHECAGGYCTTALGHLSCPVLGAAPCLYDCFIHTYASTPAMPLFTIPHFIKCHRGNCLYKMYFSIITFIQLGNHVYNNLIRY